MVTKENSFAKDNLVMFILRHSVTALDDEVLQLSSSGFKLAARDCVGSCSSAVAAAFLKVTLNAKGRWNV
jgi:hypothetical protein